jgi:hypothetical protein
VLLNVAAIDFLLRADDGRRHGRRLNAHRFVTDGNGLRSSTATVTPGCTLLPGTAAKI